MMESGRYYFASSDALGRHFLWGTDILDSAAASHLHAIRVTSYIQASICIPLFCWPSAAVEEERHVLVIRCHFYTQLFYIVGRTKQTKKGGRERGEAKSNAI